MVWRRVGGRRACVDARGAQRATRGRATGTAIAAAAGEAGVFKATERAAHAAHHGVHRATNAIDDIQNRVAHRGVGL